MREGLLLAWPGRARDKILGAGGRTESQVRPKKNPPRDLGGYELQTFFQRLSGSKHFQDDAYNLVLLDCDQSAGAWFQFDFPLRQRLFANANAERESNQLGIFELHSRPLVAVVEDDLHTPFRELGVNFLGQSHHRTVRSHIQRRDANGVRRDGQRPDDAVLVVALFEDGLQGAGHTDAVRAHNGRLLFAGGVKEQRPERLAVFGSQLEHVTDFDRPPDFERPTTAHTRFTSPYETQVCPMFHRDVALDRNVTEMEAVFIGACGHPAGTAQRFV